MIFSLLYKNSKL